MQWNESIHTIHTNTNQQLVLTYAHYNYKVPFLATHSVSVTSSMLGDFKPTETTAFMQLQSEMQSRIH